MRIGYLFFLLVLTAGCSIPSAAPEKNPDFVIATDVLTEKDSLLFAQFAEKNKVKLVLRQLSTDSLIALYQTNPFETGIDVVLIHHLFDMRQVDSNNMLQPLRHVSDAEQYIFNEEKTFVTCGIDPFICVNKKNQQVNIYDDLSKAPYILDLSATSQAHFFAPFQERLHRAKTYERIVSLMETALPPEAVYRDSARTILTTYSTYRTSLSKDTTWSAFNQIQFPNRTTSGVFHDMITAGIIRQNSHYNTATRFLQWLLQPEINRAFNANRGYDPIRSTGKYRRFPTAPDKLMQYHTMIARMLRGAS